MPDNRVGVPTPREFLAFHAPATPPDWWKPAVPPKPKGPDAPCDLTKIPNKVAKAICYRHETRTYVAVDEEIRLHPFDEPEGTNERNYQSFKITQADIDEATAWHEAKAAHGAARDKIEWDYKAMLSRETMAQWPWAYADFVLDAMDADNGHACGAAQHLHKLTLGFSVDIPQDGDGNQYPESLIQEGAIGQVAIERDPGDPSVGISYRESWVLKLLPHIRLVDIRDRTKISLFMDGNMWCAVYADFENLQESPAGFGATPSVAVEQLQAELAKAVAKGSSAQ